MLFVEPAVGVGGQLPFPLGCQSRKFFGFVFISDELDRPADQDDRDISIGQSKQGKKRTIVVEVKPKKETKMPNVNPKKRTKSWAHSVQTYAVNQAKWKAAREFCADRNIEFRIMTEDNLGIK